VPLAPFLMTCLLLLGFLGAIPTPSTADGWERVSASRGVIVYGRESKDTGLFEYVATGTFEAPPEAVWAVIRDFTNYPKSMMHTESSTIVEAEPGGKIHHLYVVHNPPFVSRRDYTARIVDATPADAPAGYHRETWTLSDRGPLPKDGIVRVKQNNGQWVLEPLAGGTRTRLKYQVIADPGGSVPRWIARLANSSSVPDLYESLRAAVKGRVRR
jgi:uncharacterized membrane protein